MTSTESRPICRGAGACSKNRHAQSKISRAVILLSGGIDSSTTLALARSKGHELYTLSFDYSQRHKIELESARKVAAALGVRKHLIINFDLSEIGGSALTSGMEVPKNRSQKKIKNQNNLLYSEFCILNSGIPVTYVPARNTIFLSFALAWAEVLDAGDIYIGANAVDYSGYPDCRPEYLKAYEEMANLATKASVEGKIKFRINAPLINMTKSEIIRKGAELGLDYRLTWSCYDPQPALRGVQSSKFKVKSHKKRDSKIQNDYVPCGGCDSCLFRAKGFSEAGLNDPLLFL